VTSRMGTRKSITLFTVYELLRFPPNVFIIVEAARPLNRLCHMVGYTAGVEHTVYTDSINLQECLLLYSIRTVSGLYTANNEYTVYVLSF
jgi:hypothetical protein